MTFLSRRKRPTTAPPTRAARKGLSLACLLAAVLGGTAAGPDRPLPVPPGPAFAAQPEKQPEKPFGQPEKQPGKQPVLKGKDPSEYTILPPRDIIFSMFDDPQLEKVIMNRLRQDLKDTP